VTADDQNLIVRIAARGEGVTADGRFVPLSVPGDRVGADGAVVRGPAHVNTACGHFPSCGGCQLQHLSDTAYANYIIERISAALGSQGIAPPPIDKRHLSPPKSRRRVALTAARRGKSVMIGFNESSSNRIVDVHQCEVMLPELFRLIEPLRALLKPLLLEGTRGRVVMTMADQGVDLLLDSIEVDGLTAVEALTTFGEKHLLARLSVDEGYGASARYAPGPVTVTLGGVPVAFPEGAFLQATVDGEIALVEAVEAATSGAATIVDLFAGLGTFALSLPGKVHAVEGARDAILALGATKRVSVEHRDLFRRPLAAAELNRFDAIVLDPPRAGAAAQIAEIAASKVAKIAYVSCNPATFARNTKTLIDGDYRLEWIKPVGQFRWSTHVELAAAFSR
jgi:23S rRNA (uracil1939-C5)-methyltransferase